MFPVLIYDNLCTSCTAYAKYVNKILGGQIIMVGHYTFEGKKFKQKIFPTGYDGTEMSWFVTPECAYGGRKCLVKLIQYIGNPIRRNLLVKKYGKPHENIFHLGECTTDCKTVKNVMIRSCSILTASKVIPIIE